MDALAKRLHLGVAGGKAVHAYLFSGEKGVGKRSVAAIFARSLNCTGTGERPCDECPSCLRYLAGTHPDHIVLSGEKSVKVEMVRDLIDQVSVKPFEGGRRSVVIEDADRMTPQAQNALLKTLEEPPEATVLILTTAFPGKLLPTIHSRARLIRFCPLTEAEVALALTKRGIAPDRARQLARESGGSVGNALTLDKDEAYWALRERVYKALNILRAPEDVAQASALLKDDKDEAQRVLALFESAGREKMAARETGAQSWAESDLRVPGDWMVSGVFEARRMLAANVSWQSVIERLFFTWMQGEKEFDS